MPSIGKDALHISSGGKSSSNTKSYSFRKISAVTKGFGHEDWEYFKEKYPKTSPDQCLNINFYDPINEQPIHLVADRLDSNLFPEN